MTTATASSSITTTSSLQEDENKQFTTDTSPSSIGAAVTSKEKLPHDLLKSYISRDTAMGRLVLERIETDGYVVLEGILTDQECEIELNRLWDFVQATSPGVDRHDPTTWYPKQTTTTDDHDEESSCDDDDPWPHSGWNFLAENCQSYQAGWLFSDLREKLAERVFAKIYDTTQLHSSKEGFTFFRPTVAPPGGYVHPACTTTKRAVLLRVCGKVQHDSVGEHFDQRATHTGLQCIQSSTALTHHHGNDDDACFQCWPGSHKEHAQITRDIWRGRSDWVPLTDAELATLRQRGYAPRRVPVARGSVILWRSDLVHCGAPPTVPTRNFRAVSYTCMLPAALTPAVVQAQKLREYCLGLSGDHRPNVSMPHLSQPKTKRQQKGNKGGGKHKTEKGGEITRPSKGRYFTTLPQLTWRQAELYGLVDYKDKDQRYAVQEANGRLYWDPPQELLDQAMQST